MDPITVGLQAVGFGMQLFGGLSAAGNAKHAAQIQGDIAMREGQINDQRQQQMELSARRQQLEIFRNTQRARASGASAAVSQGAQFGSGYAGGQAQAVGQGLFNAQGVNQNLQIGENIFGINKYITSDKQQLSQVQSDMATDQGWASLGGSLMKSGGTIGNIAGAGYNMFSGSGGSKGPGSLFMGGGSPSGY